MNRFAKISLTLSLIWICYSTNSNGQDLFNSVGYGLYNVGHYVTVLKDSNRYWDPSLGVTRKVMVQVWFPSDKRSRSYHYADYFRWVPNPYSVSADPDSLGKVIHYFPARHFKAVETDLEMVSEIRVRAFESNQFPDARYPVVLFSQGASGIPLNNMPLFELLASHGFVVVSYPSQNPDSNTLYGENIERGLDFQKKDLALVYRFILDRLTFIDPASIHFAGVSSGTIAQLRLIRELDINPATFISLDGSIMSTQMTDFIDLNRSPFLDCPVFIANRQHENVNTEMIELLTSSSVKTLFFTQLRHADFSSGPLLYRFVENFYGPAREGFIESYEFMVGRMLIFLGIPPSKAGTVQLDSRYYREAADW